MPQGRPIDDGLGIFEQLRYIAPKGWHDVTGSEMSEQERRRMRTRAGYTFERLEAGYVLKVIRNATADDWSFSLTLSGELIREGDASSQLAACRKAELALYNEMRDSR